MIETKILRMQESKISGECEVFSKESMKFKTDIQRLNILQLSLRMFGPHTIHTILGRFENFIGLSFEAILLCFWIFCLFCFCFAPLFCFGFLLRLKIFFCFPLSFFSWNACLSSHVAKLSSFDPSQLSSSVEDRCKDHLVYGGLRLPYKKERLWIKISKSGQVWRGPARWSLWMSPAGSVADAWGIL
jgi:hypothetical protein